jgi:hypothetical protein
MIVPGLIFVIVSTSKNGNAMRQVATITTDASVFGDMNGPLAYWGPVTASPAALLSPTEQALLRQVRARSTATTSSATAAASEAWLRFLGTMEAAYAAQAAAGEPFVPLAAEERHAVAQLAASLGVRPATALAAWRAEPRPAA